MDPSSPFPSTTTVSRPPDDTLFYSIYPDFTVLSSSTSTSSSSSSVLSLHLSILDSISPFLSSHIFHHDPFSLSLSLSPPFPHLSGHLRFGDDIDDEWFTVFLLFHISRSHPHVTIHVSDSDGEFLLIEAAYHLPKWLQNPNQNPNSNRCFIRNGKVCLISKEMDERGAEIGEVLKWLIETDEKLMAASDEVQEVIMRRVNEFPEKERRNMHRVRVRVPVRVAKVLREEPGMVSLAVEGFYDRDVDTMKYLMRMDRFRGSDKDEMVVVNVRMTRVMYAKLMQQRFQAPKGYVMPMRSDGERFVEAELGMKIACGMEMMYQMRNKEGEEGKGGTWKAFVTSLEGNGYFEGLLPGSKEYNRLMRNAEEYYQKSSLHKRTSEILSAPVRRIDEILAMPHSVDDFVGVEVLPSDDDSWLYSGEDELNAALSERQREMDLYEQAKKNKKKGKKKGDDHASSSMERDNFDLGDIAKSMQAFVNKVSSYQGAKVPQNRDLEEVDFDPDRLIKEMEAVFGRTASEDVDSDDTEGLSFDLDSDESDDVMDDTADLEEDDEADTESFLNTYSHVLNKELKTTTLNKSFIRASDESDKKNKGTSGAVEEDMDEEFTPVDVDVNLVKNILDSFYSQQGLPGPASNLLGLMGVQLPRDTNKDK